MKSNMISIAIINPTGDNAIANIADEYL